MIAGPVAGRGESHQVGDSLLRFALRTWRIEVKYAGGELM